MRSYADELRALVLEQTTRVGTPVANLHGAARGIQPRLPAAEDSSWLVLQLPNQQYTTFESFYQGLAATSLNAAPSIRTAVAANRGAVVVAVPPGAGTTTTVLRGTVDVATARSLTCAVDTGGTHSTLLVSVNGQVVQQGTGATTCRLALDAGRHLLEILGTGPALGVKLPPDVLVTGFAEATNAPVWRSVTTGYLDATSGTARVTLAWHADPRAGGWRVLKRQLLDLATIMAVGEPTAAGDVTITLSGDQLAEIPRGADFYAGPDHIGTAQRVEYDATGDVTYVATRLAPGRLTVRTSWVGLTAATGAFHEVARLARATADEVVIWDDPAVRAGEYYEYALQAYGMVDLTAWSPLSAVWPVRAGDFEAPGSITFATGYPKVIDTLARVRYTTPTDDDYAGVRIYHRDAITGTATGGTATSILTASGAVVSATLNHRVRLVGGTGAGQDRAITGLGGSSLQVSPAWLTTPDASSEFLVYQDTLIKTDFGRPGQSDDFTFEPLDTAPNAPIQRYHFRTFDKAHNEQRDIEGVEWLYDPATNAQTALEFATVEITLVSATATTVTLAVTATTTDSGTPQVQWTGASGSTTRQSGATQGTLVASGSQWVFTRPDPLTQPAEVRFASVLSSTVTDTDTFVIPEQGRDTVGLRLTAQVQSVTASEVVVRVTATDPYPQGANTITLAAPSSTGVSSITPSTAQLVSSGGFVDYTIERPLGGTQPGEVRWTATAANRVSDVDHQTIPEQATLTLFTQCLATLVSATATQCTVSVQGTATGGTPQVRLKSAPTGSATVASGAAAGTLTASPGVWVFNRGAFDAGPGQAVFESVLAGYASDTDSLEIPEQGRDTVLLRCRVTVIDDSTYEEKVKVRVLVTDPVPTGGTYSIAYDASAGVLVRNGTDTAVASTLITGKANLSWEDYWLYRPVATRTGGRAVFTVSGAGRIADYDSVDLSPLQRVVPELTFTMSSTATTTTITPATTNGATIQYESPSTPGTFVTWSSGGIVYNRPTAGSSERLVTLRATLSGQTVTKEIAIQPQAGASGTPTVPWVFIDGTCQGSYTGSWIAPTWSGVDLPTGVTFDLSWTMKSNAPSGFEFGAVPGATSGDQHTQQYVGTGSTTANIVVKALFEGEQIAIGAANVTVDLVN